MASLAVSAIHAHFPLHMAWRVNAPTCVERLAAGRLHVVNAVHRWQKSPTAEQPDMLSPGATLAGSHTLP